MASLFNADKILSNSRNPWMDYAKGICILAPVYRHTFEGLRAVGWDMTDYKWIKLVDVFTMGFRMPVFFMIAGAFFATSIARRGFGGYIVGRWKGVLYPLLVWGGLQITFQFIFRGTVTANRSWIDYTYLITDPRQLEQFWYLNALFFISVLYAIMNWYAKFKPIHQLGFALVLYCIASYFYNKGIDIGAFTGITFYYIFFTVGDVLHEIILDEKHHKWLSSFKTTAILIVPFIAIETYATMLNLAHPEHEDFWVQRYRQEVFLFSSLIGVAFTVHVAFLLQRFNILRFLRVIGYHALYIYLTHLFITSGLRILFVKVLGITNFPLLFPIIFAGGILGPMIFYNIARKYGFTWIFTLREDSLGKKPAPQPAPVTAFSAQPVMPKENTTSAQS